tara:strand:- start:4844 stop:5470 length:627 start_codon:yes stop_codon:yes gene_type:complete
MENVDRDDFEEKMIQEMSRMFADMGMPIDTELLQNLIRQVREQFEAMGMDPENMKTGDIRMAVNSDTEDFRKQMESMLNGPGGMADLFKNMGINVQFQGSSNVGDVIKPAEVEVNIDDLVDGDLELPVEDVFIHEDRMCVTIDISRLSGLKSEDVELNITDSGRVLQLMKTTQLRPLKRYKLPHSAKNIAEWNVNNGILDVKFDISKD